LRLELIVYHMQAVYYVSNVLYGPHANYYNLLFISIITSRVVIAMANKVKRTMTYLHTEDEPRSSVLSLAATLSTNISQDWR
jgi:hypothetical protein